MRSRGIENSVVTAFGLTGPPHRDNTGRVAFTGAPSPRWSPLIGTSNPGKSWGVAAESAIADPAGFRVFAAAYRRSTHRTEL
ncbi:hypothetical protein ABZS88_43175 [Streptomyces sp. NPDC005480]|uniref:hypothetical protein n=1 Tax=Streptomyces sp. NPDC005480 TaxID=3154880 RepID=UPI0033B9DBF1